MGEILMGLIPSLGTKIICRMAWKTNKQTQITQFKVAYILPQASRCDWWGCKKQCHGSVRLRRKFGSL